MNKDSKEYQAYKNALIDAIKIIEDSNFIDHKVAPIYFNKAIIIDKIRKLMD